MLGERARLLEAVEEAAVAAPEDRSEAEPEEPDQREVERPARDSTQNAGVGDRQGDVMPVEAVSFEDRLSGEERDQRRGQGEHERYESEHACLSPQHRQ